MYAGEDFQVELVIVPEPRIASLDEVLGYPEGQFKFLPYPVGSEDPVCHSRLWKVAEEVDSRGRVFEFSIYDLNYGRLSLQFTRLDSCDTRRKTWHNKLS